MTTSIYPQVTKGYKTQGARQVIQYTCVVRKAYLGVYYFIPLTITKAIMSEDLRASAEQEALQSLHEEAYKVIHLQTFASLRLANGQVAAIYDDEQTPEAQRVASFYGLGVPKEGNIELDAEGKVIVVSSKEELEQARLRKMAEASALLGKSAAPLKRKKFEKAPTQAKVRTLNTKKNNDLPVTDNRADNGESNS